MSTLATRLALLQRQAGHGRVPAAVASVRPTATTSSATAARGEATPETVRDEVSNRHLDATSTPTLAPASFAEAVRGEVSNRFLDVAHRPTPTPSASTIATLRRLLGLRTRASGATALPAHAFDRDLPGSEIAPGLRLHEHRLAWPLPSAARLDLAGFDLGTIDAARLKFFDTETTGLAGGTGTRAFMLGLGDWHDGAFRVRQLTLTTLGGETAMLDHFAAWLEPDALLVSYNGRSYDAPLLATRYRLARRTSPLPALAHLDLLHPVRRRYRGAWGNCRLATVERELLGVVRDDDLPGSEAPRAWLTWLRGGSARDLRRVGDHNRQDLASLAGVLLRMIDVEAVPTR